MQILSYLFSPIPGPVFNYIEILLVYSGLLVLTGILLKVIFIVKKTNRALKRTLKTAPSQFIWCGIIIGLLALSRTNGVPYLSMRFILFVFVALSIFYIGKSVYRMIKVYPELKVSLHKPEQKEVKELYTTKKKK